MRKIKEDLFVINNMLEEFIINKSPYYNKEKILFFIKIWREISLDIEDISRGAKHYNDDYRIIEFFEKRHEMIKNQTVNLEIQMGQALAYKNIKEYFYKKEKKYILFIAMFIVVILPIFFQFRGLDYFINYFK